MPPFINLTFSPNHHCEFDYVPEHQHKATYWSEENNSKWKSASDWKSQPPNQGCALHVSERLMGWQNLSASS